MIQVFTRTGGTDVTVGDDQAESIPESPQPSAPVIDSVAQNDPTSLIVSYHNATPFSFVHYQRYLDAALTELDQDASGPTGSPGPVTAWTLTDTGLNLATDYWYRLKVSADGITYSPDWSNVVMGTTLPP